MLPGTCVFRTWVLFKVFQDSRRLEKRDGKLFPEKLRNPRPSARARAIKLQAQLDAEPASSHFLLKFGSGSVHLRDLMLLFKG